MSQLSKLIVSTTKRKIANEVEEASMKCAIMVQQLEAEDIAEIISFSLQKTFETFTDKNHCDLMLKVLNGIALACSDRRLKLQAKNALDSASSLLEVAEKSICVSDKNCVPEIKSNFESVIADDYLKTKLNNIKERAIKLISPIFDLIFPKEKEDSDDQ